MVASLGWYILCLIQWSKRPELVPQLSEVVDRRDSLLLLPPVLAQACAEIEPCFSMPPHTSGCARWRPRTPLTLGLSAPIVHTALLCCSRRPARAGSALES